MLKIDNKIEFENNCWVGIADSSEFNKDEVSRVKAVTDMASITTGRLGYGEEYSWDRRVKLYSRLLKESAGKPSTPFEFVPRLINSFGKLNQGTLSFMKYTTFSKGMLLSNHRQVCSIPSNRNWRIKNYNIPEEVEDFKIIIGQVPWKVISHLRTHRAFSWLVESSRNKKYLNEVEFWYPSWWDDYTKQGFKEADDTLLDNIKPFINTKVIKPEEATMELSDRRLVKFAMAAWIEPSSWENLRNVRGVSTGTMSITQLTVDNICKLVFS